MNPNVLRNYYESLIVNLRRVHVAQWKHRCIVLNRKYGFRIKIGLS